MAKDFHRAAPRRSGRRLAIENGPRHRGSGDNLPIIASQLCQQAFDRRPLPDPRTGYRTTVTFRVESISRAKAP